MTTTQRKPVDNTYYIYFDSEEFPGSIIAVKVKIDQEIIREKDLDRPLPVNLSEHPLYEKLATYVIHNMPRRSRRVEAIPRTGD